MSIAATYDAVFIDLDGVVYRGDQPIAAAASTIATLRRAGSRLLFLTNNSSRTVDEVAEVLGAMGIEVAPEEVLTSAVATAEMLSRDGSAGSTAYVIGRRGIRTELERIGVALCDGEPERVDLVVVGWDSSTDYAKLRRAGLLVQRGARLVATNPDGSYPAADGLWPGAGALLAAVVATTGAVPTVVGKPHRAMFDAARSLTGAQRPLVIGDRLDTDVAGAAGVGWESMLVLTGASTEADLVASPGPVPTHVGRDLGAVLQDGPTGRFDVAGDEDRGAIAALLQACALRPPRGDADGATVVCRGEGANDVTATATVEEVEPGTGLLRSVAVAAPFRGTGLGALIVAHAARAARRRAIRDLYLFTETAERFFHRLGFSRLARDELPVVVASTPQAREECAETAVPMTLRLEQ